MKMFIWWISLFSKTVRYVSILVKYLLKISAIECIFVIFVSSATFFRGNLSSLQFSFPNTFLITCQVFVILFWHFSINVEKCSFFDSFLMDSILLFLHSVLPFWFLFFKNFVESRCFCFEDFFYYGCCQRAF